MSQEVEKVQSSVDEMELYAAVNKKFRQVYTRQEHMKTFKTYDRLEVNCVHCFCGWHTSASPSAASVDATQARVCPLLL